MTNEMIECVAEIIWDNFPTFSGYPERPKWRDADRYEEFNLSPKASQIRGLAVKIITAMEALK